MPNEEWIWWNLHFSNRPCSALIVCKNSHCALSHVYLFLFASRSLKRLEMSVKYVGTCTSSNTCGLKLIKGNPMGFFLFCNAMFWWTGSCGVCISYSSSTSINAHIHSTNAWGAVIFCGGNVTKEVAVKKKNTNFSHLGGNATPRHIITAFNWYSNINSSFSFILVSTNSWNEYLAFYQLNAPLCLPV